jgi:hypothetical protein
MNTLKQAKQQKGDTLRTLSIESLCAVTGGGGDPAPGTAGAPEPTPNPQDVLNWPGRQNGGRTWGGHGGNNNGGRPAGETGPYPQRDPPGKAPDRKGDRPGSSFLPSWLVSLWA